MDLTVSYNAWCRHNGHYRSRVRGNVNWNDLMTCQMQTDLNEPWKEIFAKLKKLHPELVSVVIDSLRHFMDNTLCGRFQDTDFGHALANTSSLPDVPTTERNMLFATVQNTISVWQHRMASEFERLTKDTK